MTAVVHVADNKKVDCYNILGDMSVFQFIASENHFLVLTETLCGILFTLASSETNNTTEKVVPMTFIVCEVDSDYLLLNSMKADILPKKRNQPIK